MKDFKAAPIWIAITVSWAIAFFEYCFQVPANRIGATYFSLPQLKVMQEVITMVVFASFSVTYMKVPITRNYFFAAMLLAVAALAKNLVNAVLRRLLTGRSTIDESKVFRIFSKYGNNSHPIIYA